jgi:hypothetical protein
MPGTAGRRVGPARTAEGRDTTWPAVPEGAADALDPLPARARPGRLVVAIGIMSGVGKFRNLLLRTGRAQSRSASAAAESNPCARWISTTRRPSDCDRRRLHNAARGTFRRERPHRIVPRVDRQGSTSRISALFLPEGAGFPEVRASRTSLAVLRTDRCDRSRGATRTLRERSRECAPELAPPRDVRQVQDEAPCKT